MRLRGIPPEGVHGVSYVGAPEGSIIGSAARPIGKIISVPGLPGPQGEEGPKGDKGDQGDTGADSTVPGPPGPSTTISIGTVTTGNTGTPASASVTGSSPEQVLHLTLPRGAQGIQGVKGDKGDKGDTGDQGIQGPQGLKGDKGDQGIQGIPGEVSEAQLQAALAAVVDAAPGTMDTLNELAAALGDDPNFATTVSNNIGLKADKATTITAGTGLAGGGDLSAPRSFSVQFGTSSTTACRGDDSRLSDARTPTAHAHAISDVTNLQSNLDAKAAASLLPVQITQAAYNALGAGRPARIYAIVG